MPKKKRKDVYFLNRSQLQIFAFLVEPGLLPVCHISCSECIQPHSMHEKVDCHFSVELDSLKEMRAVSLFWLGRAAVIAEKMEVFIFLNIFSVCV